MEKSTFHETKEVVTRLREPFKIKAVPYATTKVRVCLIPSTDRR